MMAQQATSFLDCGRCHCPVATRGPGSGHVYALPAGPPQPSAPGAATHAPGSAAARCSWPCPDDVGTIQPASAVGYAAAAARPHHPNSYLDKSGDATTPYTVTSFATSLKQRDFILKALCAGT